MSNISDATDTRILTSTKFQNQVHPQFITLNTAPIVEVKVKRRETNS